MALHREGKAAMAADGTVTGTGTKWQSSLSLIRPGATIMFLSSPIQMAVVNKVVSDTEIKAITTNGAVVASTDYAILLSDSLTVDGLAQDVAETLRYYQSQETVIADAVEFFKSFDFDSLQDLANQIKQDSESAGASATAAAASETAAKNSETNAKASETASKTARDQVQQIINDAGEQSTLVVLAQPTGAGKSGLLQGGTVQDTIFWHTPEAEGAKGDGVTDDLAALVATDLKALASGLPVYLGPKTYAISNCFEFRSNHFFGVEGKTRILALNGWNDAIVKSKGAPAGDYLTINSPSSMVNGVILENIIIEGGWGGPDDTTRTHTEALRIYGAGTKLKGIRCGYVSGVGFNLGGRGNTTIKYGAPSLYTDLRSDFTGEHGIVIGGSSDNHTNWLVVRNAGLKQHNTYDGIRFGGGGGTRGTQFHVWQSGDAQITPYYTNRVRYGLYLASYDSEIVSGHIEGCASAQIIFVGARNSVSSFRVYSNWQAGAAVIMLGDANRFIGEVGAPMNNTPSTAVHALQIGDASKSVKNYEFRAYVYGTKFVNYINSEGGEVNIKGDLTVPNVSGIGTVITGTIPASEWLKLKSPQYTGLWANINMNSSNTISCVDMRASGNIDSGGLVTLTGLTESMPTASGRLYKDANGFVKVKQ